MLIYRPYVIIVAFNEAKSYPIRYAVGIIVGAICLVLCIAMFVYYLHMCQIDKKYARIKFDVVLLVLYFVPNYYIVGEITDTISKLI